MHSLKTFSAAALAILLFAGILTQWVPYRWAVSLFQTGAFALAISWAIKFLLQPFALKGSVLLVPLSAALLWGLAQLALGRSVYRWETWDSVLNWATNLTLFFLALQIFSEPDLRERFLRAILYFAAVLSVLGCIQMFTSEGRIFWLFPSGYSEFVVGPFVYHNQYAGFIELVLPLAVVGALEDRRRLLLCAAIAATLYASVIAAASRAGTVLVTLEILAIVLLAPRRNRLSLRNRAHHARAGNRLRPPVHGGGWLGHTLAQVSPGGPVRRPPGILAVLPGHDPRPPLDGIRTRNLVHGIPRVRPNRQRPVCQPGA